MIKTKFVAYDRYRADCTRWAFVRRSEPDWSSASSSLKMHNGNEELYMEFGEPYRVEHGLPDDLPTRDGMICEVQLYVYLSKDRVYINDYTWKVYSFYTQNLKLGISDHKAPSGAITYKNRPAALYSVPGSDNLPFMDTKSNRTKEKIGTSAYDTTPAAADLYSHGECYPKMVEEAVRNGALWLKPDASGSGENYNVVVSMQGTYKAYVEILYGYVEIERYIDSPRDGYLDPYKAQQLKWGWEGKELVYPDRQYVSAPPVQQYADVTITVPGEQNSRAFHVDGETNVLDVPEDVLGADNFEWNVKVTTTAGQVTPDAPNISITTIDSLSTASAIAPKNTYVNVDEAVFFDWSHIITTGTQQSKYELQGLVDGVWTTLQEGETNETSAVVPVNTLSSNITAWRVRTANNDGVYGEYSDPAQAIFIVAPKLTSVAVTGNVRPTVSWQSADQQGYEVMVDGISTGVQYGTEKKLTWNELLADGAHVVQVRVVNRFGLFSQWEKATHEVNNVPQETSPTLTVAAVNVADMQLAWDGDGAVEALIYRDGVLIDRVRGANVYVDHTAHGRHTYRVRAVADDSNYTDSNEVHAAVPLRDSVLAAVGEWKWIKLAYSATAEPPVRTAALAPVYALNYYSGREKPVAEMSKHKSATYNVTYAVTENQAKQLRDVLGKIVVHKRRGEMIRGLLESVSEARTWWGVDATLQIAEVDEG